MKSLYLSIYLHSGLWTQGFGRTEQGLYIYVGIFIPSNEEENDG